MTLKENEIKVEKILNFDEKIEKILSYLLKQKKTNKLIKKLLYLSIFLSIINFIF